VLTAIVSVETVLLVLLVVLVAGLLRSHAEILRRLGPESARGDAGPGADTEPAGLARPVPPRATARDGGDARAPELAGVTPRGDAVKLAFDGRGGASILLAFLSSGCTSCATFWETLGARSLPTGLEAVIVTRGADREQRSRLRSLAPDRVPVVMSSEAWQDYAVPGSPYFVLVEDGAVKGEGVATTWQALSSLLADAIEEQREAGAGGSATERARRIDETLIAAGIAPDHPSLFPGQAPRAAR
jgi:hypothetical protein